MSIQAIVNISPNFQHQNPYNKGKLVSVKRFPDYEERIYEREGSTGKKWGVGIASGIIPGLGQAINGSWGKAAGFFFGNMAVGLVGRYTGAKIPALLCGLGVNIWSIVDAVKGAKSKATEIVPHSN